MFKTRRQNRYSALRKAGMLPFEARPLSKVPVRVCPYMKQLTKERYQDFLKAKAEGATRTGWENRIKKLYSDNRWLRAGKRRIEADPWKMLREYEDRWRARFPQYTSPSEKKWRDWKDYQRKIERTIAKQRGMA